MVEVLHQQNKQRFGNYLNKIASSPQFKSLLSSKVGDGYKMIQYESRYKHQCLQILAYQYSSMGGNTARKIFQISVNDIYEHFLVELDHISKTGLCQLIIDNNNNVCLISYIFDQSDRPPSHTHKDEKLSKSREIQLSTYYNDKTYETLILSKKNNVKYGEICQFAVVAVRPDLRSKGLLGLDVVFLCAALMGYKYMWAFQAHKYTVSSGEKLIKRSLCYDGFIQWKTTSAFNFADFIFKDGTSINEYYQKLSELGYNDVNKLKENSVMVMMFGFVDISKTIGVSEVINMWYRSRKMIKTNSRL